MDTPSSVQQQGRRQRFTLRRVLAAMAFTELHTTNLLEAGVEKSTLFILSFSGSGLHINNSTLRSMWVSATLKFIPAPSS